LLGGCTDRVATYNTMLAAHRRSERAHSDQAIRVAVRRLIPPTPRSSSLTPSLTTLTLQHDRLPSVTTNVTRDKSKQY
jgi:hypothetical protein